MTKHIYRLLLINIVHLLFFNEYLLAPTKLDKNKPKPSLKEIMQKSIPFRSDGKIKIPKHIKHVKLDIGLSYNAPLSQYWLTHENDLLVFGFEPNPTSVHAILNGSAEQLKRRMPPLDRKFIGKEFFLIPCALGLSRTNGIKFYVTKDDPGCSSIYPPKYFELERIISVPMFPLSDFFDLFPFDTHPVIDYIKIDTQGSDLNIIKSGRKYIQERVIYITLEAENYQYQNTINSENDIDKYMKSIGFIRYISPFTYDPTYFNQRFSDYTKTHEIQIFQG